MACPRISNLAQGGVAADIEVSACFEPSPDLGAVLQRAMLDVDLVGLVARKGGIEARQEIGGGVLVAEEQPVVAGGSALAALRQEGSKRSDPVPGPTMITGAASSSGRPKCAEG